MFAGSYPERIGNPDDPDDVMIIELGITILDEAQLMELLHGRA